MKIQKWDEINGTGSSEDRMEAFLSSETDTYAILQLSYDQPEQTAFERFESLNGLARQGKQPNIDHYEVVYTAPLLPYKDLGTMLEQMYEKFNIDHPADFRGHSLSVSDIIAIRQNGIVSCHYVDSIGFKELPEFLKPENYLKNAEMAMEDDYGMIDGIINNGKADRIKDMEEKRPSVLEQVLLYGDGTKAGLEKALTDMRETLQPDEAELMKMTDRLLKKLRHMTEPAFQKLVEE